MTHLPDGHHVPHHVETHDTGDDHPPPLVGDKHPAVVHMHDGGGGHVPEPAAGLTEVVSVLLSLFVCLQGLVCMSLDIYTVSDISLYTMCCYLQTTTDMTKQHMSWPNLVDMTS